MEYSPPPLFKQGASARAKVTLFALISIGLLFADSRLHALTVVRQAVGTALYPLQVMALWPRDAAYAVGDYFVSLTALERENKKLREQQIANGQTLQQAQQLRSENAQLRRLLGASEQLPVRSLMSEILYDARDAFTRKIVLNRGTRHGVAPGQPVIDDIGVIGQVTRVFPFSSEVTLLTDKDQAIPVQVVRSGLRSVAYGRGQSGVLDLRFMPVNADIQKDDILVTSGIDGVYPPGLSVAKVVQVEHKSSDAFARVLCQPMAGIDRNRQLLILLVDTAMLPRPSPEEYLDKGRSGKKRAPDAAKEAAPAQPVAPVPAAPAQTMPKEAAKEAPKPAADAAILPKDVSKATQPEARKETTPVPAAPAAQAAPATPAPAKPAAPTKMPTP
ncbi:MAG TPA: rod shape-determining protein MreC [Paucimonas sp.]|nr:rod shape-determining protein MreC [Paucimonas sp.]